MCSCVDRAFGSGATVDVVSSQHFECIAIVGLVSCSERELWGKCHYGPCIVTQWA